MTGAEGFPVLVAAQGLPGAGKTTWAQRSGMHVVCRDDVRHEMFGERRGPRWDTASSRVQEEAVGAEMRDRAARLLEAGHDVVVDSMNAEEAFVRAWRELAEDLGCHFRVETLVVALDVLLERNSSRSIETRVEPEEIAVLVARYPHLVLAP